MFSIPDILIFMNINPQMTIQLTSFIDEDKQYVLNLDYVCTMRGLDHENIVHDILNIRI